MAAGEGASAPVVDACVRGTGPLRHVFARVSHILLDSLAVLRIDLVGVSASSPLPIVVR
jgi:hypothetical protein